MKWYENPAVHTAIVTVVALALTAVFAVYLTNTEDGSLLYLIFMAGTIGGVANTYQRMFRLAKVSDVVSNDPVASLLVILQIWLSPLVGGIFAMVLFVIFMAGLLQGEMFPAFQAIDDRFTNPEDFSDVTLPANNVDAAKALIWAFVAGFAERFVPNFLDKIARSEEEERAEEDTGTGTDTGTDTGTGTGTGTDTDTGASRSRKKSSTRKKTSARKKAPARKKKR